MKSISIEKIQPYERNAKKHPKDQVQKIANSIKEFGFNQPIVIDKTNTIIVGHGRYYAALELGYTKVPYLQVELSQEKANAYRLADNKLNESDWDMELVVDELKGLSDEMVELTGFEKDLTLEPEEKDDEVPETPEEPTAQLGDIYQLGKHRVMCGDATKQEDVEKLMNGEKADMVFTDPPYGYSYESNHYKKGNPHGMLQNDDQYLDFLPTALIATENNVPFYIFCGWQNAHQWRGYVEQCDVLNVKNMIVWKKNNWSMGDLKGAYAGQYELCIFAHKGYVELANGRDRDIWEANREPAKHHPTTKPVELAVRAMKNHTSNRIFDPFLGSGSTLIAAEKTGRICYGMELDPKYVDVIIQRWEEYTGQKAEKVSQ